MKAIWLPTNLCWVITYRDVRIPILDYWSFDNRNELENTLAQCGLKLNSNNSIGGMK
jgi:hypothetical protein